MAPDEGVEGVYEEPTGGQGPPVLGAPVSVRAPGPRWLLRALRLPGCPGSRAVRLSSEDRRGVLADCLNNGEHRPCILLLVSEFPLQEGQHVHQEEGHVLREQEVPLQRLLHAELRAPAHQPGLGQRVDVQLHLLRPEGALRLGALRRGDKVPQLRRTIVAVRLRALEQAEDRPLRQPEARLQGLGSAPLELNEGGLVPGRVVPDGRGRSPLAQPRLHRPRLFALDPSLEPRVLGDVRRRHGHDAALRVEPAAASTARYLVEGAAPQDGGPLAVELAELCEEDRADGDVDANAEGVRSADAYQQPALRQLLHQQPVLRQEARMVQANAVQQQLSHPGAVGRVELGACHRLRDPLPPLARERQPPRRHQAGGQRRRVVLRETDHVGGHLALCRELAYRILNCTAPVGPVQGDGAFCRGYLAQTPACQALDHFVQARIVPYGC
mmetsp:Transcript_59703/g.187248  ORF Transcript_59703/g.187248 Transcript_59703/m.187248 type:complete len:441 (+) Transcript_59703:963-2285(+)